jgi:hypothetical protein
MWSEERLGDPPVSLDIVRRDCSTSSLDIGVNGVVVVVVTELGPTLNREGLVEVEAGDSVTRELWLSGLSNPVMLTRVVVPALIHLTLS